MDPNGRDLFVQTDRDGSGFIDKKELLILLINYTVCTTKFHI